MSCFYEQITRFVTTIKDSKKNTRVMYKNVYEAMVAASKAEKEEQEI
jgi:hypothetical protein